MTEGESSRLKEERSITGRINMTTRESKDVILIESLDRESDGWLHRNYLTR
jgi:hypothetical protein